MNERLLRVDGSDAEMATLAIVAIFKRLTGADLAVAEGGGGRCLVINADPAHQLGDVDLAARLCKSGQRPLGRVEMGALAAQLRQLQRALQSLADDCNFTLNILVDGSAVAKLTPDHFKAVMRLLIETQPGARAA